jgi:hypothetical protein
MTLSEHGLRAFRHQCGIGRARFWRTLGFPNLVLARAARAKKRAASRAKAFSPYANPDDLPK